MGFEKIGTEVLETAKKVSESLKIEEIDKRINIHETKIKKETSITIEDYVDKRIDVPTIMTDADREKLKDETGWSNEIIDSIQTVEEADILKNADVHEEEINGKKCLVRNDIDMDQLTPDGRTNRERMENGNAPYDKSGKPIELHHIGQRKDSPLAELTGSEHDDIPNVNSNTENPSSSPSWQSEKRKYWAERSKN